MHRLLMAVVGFSVLLAGQPVFSQPTQVTIDRNAGPTRIGIAGQVGATFNLESASSLTATGWDFQLTLPLTNSPQSWFDAYAASAAQRYYRAVKLAAPPEEWGVDFRLIDQLGRSRWLFYHTDDTNVLAMVLIFTGNGCQKVRDMMPAIKALTNQFTPQKVSFWLVDANQADNRSNILVEATSLGISNGPPILHDAAQLVARTYNATTTPEAVAINMADSAVFYRGAIDDRIGSNAVATTQHYLSNALVNFLAAQPVSPTRTRPSGCDIGFAALSPSISYSTEIAPLLQNKCVRCHSPGNIAPWAMTNHAIVQAQAASIKQEILSGRMPPWHADHFYQSFTNDISLSPSNAALLVKWIDDGAPRGGGIDPLTNVPPQTDYPFAWPASLGTPDIIIPIGNQAIPASGQIDYRYVFIPYTGPSVSLRAAIILPGTVPAVHHLVAGTGADDVLHSFMTLYVPGTYLGAFPSNTYKFLANGTTIGFQLHYTAIGVATNDASLLGLYTNAVTSGFPLIQTSVADSSASWTIPPNANEYQWVRTNAAFTTNVWLHEVYPHMHTRGSRAKYEALYTNGTSEVLLSVPGYEFHWQTTYRFTQPKFLPKGTSIKYTCAWDNSVLNQELMEVFTDPDNPNNYRYSPTNSVKWGEQTWQEMFIGYYSYSLAP